MRPWLPQNRVVVTNAANTAAKSTKADMGTLAAAAAPTITTTATSTTGGIIEVPSAPALDLLAKAHHIDVGVTVLHATSSSSSASIIGGYNTNNHHQQQQPLFGNATDVPEVNAEEIPLVVGAALPAALTAAFASPTTDEKGIPQLPSSAYYPNVVPCYELADCRLPPMISYALLKGQVGLTAGIYHHQQAGGGGGNTNNNGSSSNSGAKHPPMKALRTLQQYTIPFLLQHSSAAMVANTNNSSVAAAASTASTSATAAESSAAPLTTAAAPSTDAVTFSSFLDGPAAGGSVNAPMPTTSIGGASLLPLPLPVPFAANNGASSSLPMMVASSASSTSSGGGPQKPKICLAVTSTPGSGKTVSFAVSLAALLVQRIQSLVDAARRQHQQQKAHNNNHGSGSVSSTHQQHSNKTIGALATASGPMAIIFVSSREAEQQYRSILEGLLAAYLEEKLYPDDVVEQQSSRHHHHHHHHHSGGHKRDRSRDRSRSRSADRSRRHRSRSRSRDRHNHHNSSSSAGTNTTTNNPTHRVVAKSLYHYRHSLVVVQNVFQLERDLFVPYGLVNPSAATNATGAHDRNNNRGGHHHNNNPSPRNTTGSSASAVGGISGGGTTTSSYKTLPPSFLSGTTAALEFLIFDPLDVFLAPPIKTAFPTQFWNWLRHANNNSNASSSAQQATGGNGQQQKVQVWINHSCVSAPSSSSASGADVGSGSSKINNNTSSCATTTTKASSMGDALNKFVVDVLKRDAMLWVRQQNHGCWYSAIHDVAVVQHPSAIVPLVFERILTHMRQTTTVIRRTPTPPPLAAPPSDPMMTLAAPTTTTIAPPRLGSSTTAYGIVPSASTAPLQHQQQQQAVPPARKEWHSTVLLYVHTKGDATVLKGALAAMAEAYSPTTAAPLVPTLSPSSANVRAVLEKLAAADQQTAASTDPSVASPSPTAASAAPIVGVGVVITAADVKQFVEQSVMFVTDWHVRTQTIPASVANVGCILNLSYSSAGVNSTFTPKQQGGILGSEALLPVSGGLLPAPNAAGADAATTTAAHQQPKPAASSAPDAVAVAELRHEMNTLSHLFASTSVCNVFTTVVLAGAMAGRAGSSGKSVAAKAIADFLEHTHQHVPVTLV